MPINPCLPAFSLVVLVVQHPSWGCLWPAVTAPVQSRANSVSIVWDDEKRACADNNMARAVTRTCTNLSVQICRDFLYFMPHDQFVRTAEKETYPFFLPFHSALPWLHSLCFDHLRQKASCQICMSEPQRGSTFCQQLNDIACDVR